GRIVILARGPSTLLAYPEKVLNSGSEAALIGPERGEYFSVSRYRETRAEFGPIANLESLQEVAILIFGSASEEGGLQLLIHQRVPTEAPPSPRPKPVIRPKKAEPAPETAEPSAAEPGAGAPESDIQPKSAAPKPAPEAPPEKTAPDTPTERTAPPAGE